MDHLLTQPLSRETEGKRHAVCVCVCVCVLRYEYFEFSGTCRWVDCTLECSIRLLLYTPYIILRCHHFVVGPGALINTYVHVIIIMQARCWSVWHSFSLNQSLKTLIIHTRRGLLISPEDYAIC